MSAFKEVKIDSLQFNPFTKINNEWMLITAGNAEKLNTMTASWGGLGVLWNKFVSFIFIRPQRYTLEFIEQQEYYTLSFFAPEHKKTLGFCGSHSGRDIDKVQETGLTPVFDTEAPYFEQAELVFVCRKLHKQTIDPKCFIDPAIDKNYADKDYHKMFIGEIVKVLVKG